jgi:hypothetical protein
MVEEYDVHPNKIESLMELLAEAKEILKEMKLPYLKGWGVYQSKYKMGRFVESWELEEQANVDQLINELMTHPKFSTVPPRFFELVIEGSHTLMFYEKALSL